MKQHLYEKNVRRFLSKIDTSGGEDACHPWRGRPFPNGYGQWQVAGRNVGAHRFIWIVTNGPIAGGLFVLHSCDNPPCCNVRHLFLGTQKQNDEDKRQKGREWRGRLTVQDIKEIRNAYDQGEPVDAADFSKRLKVTKMAIWQIGTRKIYRWVED